MTGPLTPAFEVVRTLDGPTADSHRPSSPPPTDAATEPASAKGTASSESSGQEPEALPGGWSRETKLGVAFVAILVVAFGLILYRKVDQQSAAGPELLAAGEVPSEQPSTAAPQPPPQPANPFAPPQSGEPVTQTDYTEIPRPDRSESHSAFTPTTPTRTTPTSTASNRPSPASSMPDDFTTDDFTPASQDTAFEPPSSSNHAASNPSPSSPAGTSNGSASAGFDDLFSKPPTSNPTTGEAPAVAATPAAFEPPTDASRIATTSASPAAVEETNPFAAAAPVGSAETEAAPFATAPQGVSESPKQPPVSSQDQFAQATPASSPFDDDGLLPPTPVPQRKPTSNAAISNPPAATSAGPVPVSPLAEDDWTVPAAGAPPMATAPPTTVPTAPPTVPATPTPASSVADPFAQPVSPSYAPPAAPSQPAAVSPFDTPTAPPKPNQAANPFSVPAATGTTAFPPPSSPTNSAGPISPTGPISTKPVTDVYTIRPGDNYWTISKSVYGTGRYFMALARFNAERVPDPRKLRPGMKVMTPTPQVLEASNPDLFPDNAATAPNDQPAGFFVGDDGRPMYRVGRNDTLGGIAHRHLGRFSRWVEIYRLNQGRLNDPNRLQLGTELVLPADASRVRVVRSR